MFPIIWYGTGNDTFGIINRRPGQASRPTISRLGQQDPQPIASGSYPVGLRDLARRVDLARSLGGAALFSLSLLACPVRFLPTRA
jgi:hypothetical protein